MYIITFDFYRSLVTEDVRMLNINSKYKTGEVFIFYITQLNTIVLKYTLFISRPVLQYIDPLKD